MLFSRDCIWGVTAHPRPAVKWDGDILTFLFACSRFATALNETWCDSFDAPSILAAVRKAGGQVHSTQARNAVSELVDRFAGSATMLDRQQQHEQESGKPLPLVLPQQELQVSKEEDSAADVTSAVDSARRRVSSAGHRDTQTRASG
jgi:hypothetical protein